MYPGREWATNFVGFYNDYDPRLRPWYIAATSGPKDVVIILDCRYLKILIKYQFSNLHHRNILSNYSETTSPAHPFYIRPEVLQDLIKIKY